MSLLVPLIAGLPLAGFAFTALFGRRLQFAFGKRAASLVPLLAVIGSWAAAMVVVYASLSGTAPFADGGFGVRLWEWIPAGRFVIEAGFFVDNLTAILLIVVTTVGMLVHVYSLGYMAHDEGYWRFFAFLNLFMFSMLLLVLADNFLLVFAGWELVGLCSYLLIGFWYRRRSAALAAKKAFLVNRVGDVGFALGMMLIWVNLGTLRHPPDDRANRRARPDRHHGHRSARVRGRGRQERPVPAPRLAARRHGGPHSGLGPHPCGDHGQRRRLPHRPGQPDLRPRPLRDAGGGGGRDLHRDPGRLDRVHPD